MEVRAIPTWATGALGMEIWAPVHGLAGCSPSLDPPWHQDSLSHCATLVLFPGTDYSKVPCIPESISCRRPQPL